MKAILKGRPDSDREQPQYVAEMVETLAYLTDEEHAWMSHPRTGLNTVCKFLPTPADVHEFLRERRAKVEQFRPAPTAWRKIEDDPSAPWHLETDYERKRRVVREYLGYNPGESKGEAGPRTLETPPPGFKVELKTPAAPVSESLKAFLRQQGWPVSSDASS